MEDIEDKSITFLKQHIQIILTFIIFICYLSYYYYITLFNINFNIHKKCNKSHLYYFYTFYKNYKSQIKNSLICIIFFSLIFLFIICYLKKKEIIKKKNLLIIPSLITILIISIIIIHNLIESDSNDDINEITKFYENHIYKNNVNNVNYIYQIIKKYNHIFNNFSKIDNSNYYIFRFSKIYTLTSSIDDTYHQIILDSNDINEIKNKIIDNQIIFDNKDFKYFDLKSINNTNNYITIDNINYIPAYDYGYYSYKIHKDNINNIINLIKIYNDIINNIYKIDINNHIHIEHEELFKYINYNKKDSEQNIFNYTLIIPPILPIELSSPEWNSLNIDDFTQNNYISFYDKYFKSTPDTDNLKWEQITDELDEYQEYTNTHKKQSLINLLTSKINSNFSIENKDNDNIIFDIIFNGTSNTDKNIDNTFYDRNFLELFSGNKISFFYLSDLILISIIIIIFLLLYIDRDKYLPFLTSYKFFIIIILIVIINKIYNY